METTAKIFKVAIKALLAFMIIFLFVILTELLVERLPPFLLFIIPLVISLITIIYVNSKLSFKGFKLSFKPWTKIERKWILLSLVITAGTICFYLAYTMWEPYLYIYSIMLGCLGLFFFSMNVLIRKGKDDWIEMLVDPLC